MSHVIRDVRPGTYFVLASLTGDTTMRGGHSRAVPRRLAYTCDDHGLLPVEMGSGQTVGNISPNDWYAPAGTFPPPPS